jgi:hypothetical protein
VHRGPMGVEGGARGGEDPVRDTPGARAVLCG